MKVREDKRERRRERDRGRGGCANVGVCGEEAVVAHEFVEGENSCTSSSSRSESTKVITVIEASRVEDESFSGESISRLLLLQAVL